MVDQLLAPFGLKHHPFSQRVPAHALWPPPGVQAFFHRVESVVLDGGFVLLHGEPGLGKSKILHLMSERLTGLGGDVVVGVMEYPPSSMSDFYRELGDLFGVNLSPANRYGGFKALRERWREHIQSTLFRPVLILDEAQEMLSRCLTELRLLGSARFDSDCLLTTVLCGDNQLPERFRTKQLAPLGSRIRTRWPLEPWGHKALMSFVDHSLEAAGAPHLMTDQLKTTMVHHAGGNLRILCGTGDELLRAAAERELTRLDEKLYLELYSQPGRSTERTQRRAKQ